MKTVSWVAAGSAAFLALLTLVPFTYACLPVTPNYTLEVYCIAIPYPEIDFPIVLWDVVWVCVQIPVPLDTSAPVCGDSVVALSNLPSLTGLTHSLLHLM